MLRFALRGLLALLFGAGVCRATQAHAQRTSSLGWARLAGAEACISTQVLAERVEQRVGRRVFVSASQADLALEGHVERSGKPRGWIATLVVSDRAGRVLGRRTLRAPGDDCKALEASLVLVIAIAIDPNASLDDRAAGESLSPTARAMLEQLGLPELNEQEIRDELAVPSPVAAPVEPRRKPPAPKRPVPARSTPEDPGATALTTGSASVFARIAIESWIAPDIAPGAVLGLRLQPGWVWAQPGWVVSFELWANALLPQRQALPDHHGSVKYAFFSAGIGACPFDFEALRLAFRGCAGARAGALSGSGSSIGIDSRAFGPWFEPTLYGELDWRLGSWALEAALGAGLPAVRDTYAYEAANAARVKLHRPGVLSGRLELGAALRF